MRTIASLLMGAGLLVAVPAMAAAPANTGAQITPAQFNFCIGPDCGPYDHDDWYWRHRGWRGEFGGNCRDVTIRRWEDGQMVVRHIHRCD
jgi:hypothetical protein